MNHTQNSSLPESNVSVSFAEYYVWFSLNVLTLGLSFSLFGILLVVLLVQRREKTASGFLVAHQIAVEAQVVVIHYGIYVFQSYVGLHGNGVSTRFCRNYFFTYMITVTAGNWGLFYLALNRYIALVLPHSYEAWSTKPVLLAKAGSCWVIGFLCNFSFYLGYHGGWFSARPFYTCNYAQLNGLPYLLSTVFDTYVPLTLTGFFYALLFIKIAQRRCCGKVRPPVMEIKLSRKFKPRLKLAKILFIISFIYWACFAVIPIMTAFTTAAYYARATTRLWIRSLFFWGYLSTPITFFIFNREYRAEVSKLYKMTRLGRSVYRENPDIPLAPVESDGSTPVKNSAKSETDTMTAAESPPQIQRFAM